MTDTPEAMKNQPGEGGVFIDQATMEANAPGTRPEGLPENFNSVEDLANAHKEAQRKITELSQGGSTDGGQEAQPEGQAAAEGEGGEGEAAEGLKIGQEETSGFDVQTYYKEFAEKGELSEDSYKALADNGYPKDLVDQFIAGQKAQASVAEADVLKVFGGRKGYDAAVKWAQAEAAKKDGTITPEWVENYNAAVESGDMARVNFAVQGLKALSAAALDQHGELVSGGAEASGAEPFRSMEEMAAVMNSDAYRAGDPKVHAEVEARLRASNIMNAKEL